jgi:hypothetical protein
MKSEKRKVIIPGCLPLLSPPPSFSQLVWGAELIKNFLDNKKRKI